MVFNFMGHHLDLIEIIDIHPQKVGPVDDITVDITFSGIKGAALSIPMPPGEISERRVEDLLAAYYEAKETELDELEGE